MYDTLSTRLAADRRSQFETAACRHRLARLAKRNRRRSNAGDHTAPDR